MTQTGFRQEKNLLQPMPACGYNAEHQEKKVKCNEERTAESITLLSCEPSSLITWEEVCVG